MELPRIYPITDTRISGLTHTEQVKKLIAGGATLIQLREKNASLIEFYEDASSALAEARRRGVKIIINDRVDIALALTADGVHLGQDDLPPAEARELLGPGAIIGYSTHTAEQATEASRLPVDYIAFGPVFPTKTKEDHNPVVGLEQLAIISEIAGTFPLVAIGGIDLSNVSSVISTGADSAAIIAAILKDPDKISLKTAELLNIVVNL